MPTSPIPWHAARGTYFGVSQLSLAIGGALGYLLGGMAYDYGKVHDADAAPWLAFLGIGVLTACAYWRNRQHISAIHSETTDPDPLPSVLRG